MISGSQLHRQNRSSSSSSSGYDEVHAREREAAAARFGTPFHSVNQNEILISRQKSFFSGPSKIYSATSLDSSQWTNGSSETTIPASTLERLRSLERMQSLTEGPGDELMRCALKMPAKEAEVLGTATSRISRTSSAGDRVQVPKGNKQDMAKLVDALEVANDLFKAGAISESAYSEMCTGIQGRMDELVCLWVTPL